MYPSSTSTPRRRGQVINSFLSWTGITDSPISWLLYSRFTVMLVLTYIWVPFVALPVFVSLDNLDRSLLEAASDLGASRWRTFLRVTLPLSLSGVFAAFLFVFIPTIGEFVTPLLVGGTLLHVWRLDPGPVPGQGPRLADGLDAGAVPARHRGRLDGGVRAVPPGADGGTMSEIATSPNTRRGLRVFFGLLVVFLYAPIVILAVFSFNDGDVQLPARGVHTRLVPQGSSRTPRSCSRSSAAPSSRPSRA